MQSSKENIHYENSTFRESGTWLAGLRLPDQSSNSPVAVTFRGDLYVFLQHHGTVNNGHIYYLIYRTDASGKLNIVLRSAIPNIYISGKPAVAVYGDKLYFVYRPGGDSQKLTYTTFDGQIWSRPVTTQKGILTSPALAVYRNTLYCTHQGWEEDRGTIWYSTFDGTEWSQDHPLPGLKISDSPSLAVYKGELYCAYHRADGTNTAWCIKCDGASWSHEMSMSAPVSQSPSIFTYNNRLYAARVTHTEGENLCINYLVEGTWSPDNYLRAEGIIGSPCLVEYEGKLYCFYREGNNTISFKYKEFRIIDHAIPLLDVWGEGRILADGNISGFEGAINLNLYKQQVSNGVNRHSAIPNIMPVSQYGEPDFPITCEQVQTVTLMGAPITPRVADEIGRVLAIDGRVFLFDPSKNDRRVFEERNRFRVKPIDTSKLPAPLDQISRNFQPVYGYRKYRN